MVISCGLLSEGVKFIFYPCVPYEHNEYEGTNNHYNCPIVTSYAENIKNNVEELKSENIDFRNPFMSFESEEKISKDSLRNSHHTFPPQRLSLPSKPDGMK